MEVRRNIADRSMAIRETDLLSVILVAPRPTDGGGVIEPPIFCHEVGLDDEFLGSEWGRFQFERRP